MTPTGAELLGFLIELYSEQENLRIKYEMEEVHNEHCR